MKYDTKTTKGIYRTALLLAASMLTACGGGDDEAASSCKNPLLLIPCILDGQIPTSVDATTAAGTDSSTTAVSGVVSTEGTDAEVLRFEAFEPNNTFDNANMVSMPFATNGVAIGGSLSGATNNADTFIFTPNRTGLHSIYVCAETCASAVEADGLSIMLLDQAQTTLDSTATSDSANLELAANLTAGMAYYVQVRADGFAPGGQAYNLVIVE
jgi:hypothetical protein